MTLGRYITLFFHVLLLLILYLFIFRVVVMILKDLHRERTGAVELALNQKPGLAAALRVMASDDPEYPVGQSIGLDKVVHIGRGENNEVNLSGSFASHRHARIFFSNGNYFLEDLGSTNGTYINGVRITDLVLLQGDDLVKVANVSLQFARWEHEVE